jgi:hypothetical protein
MTQLLQAGSNFLNQPVILLSILLLLVVAVVQA